MNLCVLTGNLGADPEVFFSSSDGMPIANFNMAFNSSGKKKDPDWIRITCFNRLAETAQKFLHVGARISVVGYLTQDKWENDEGEKRSTYKVIARSIDFVKTDGRGFDEEGFDNAPY